MLPNFGFLFLFEYILKNSLLFRLQVLTRLLHNLHGDLRFLTNVMEKLPLGIVNEAVVAVHVFAYFALVDSAVAVGVAFLALLLLLVVVFQQNQLYLARVIGHLEVEVGEAVLVGTVPLVNE